MNKRLCAIAPHHLDHGQRGQRIDRDRRPIAARGPLRQRHQGLARQDAVVGIHAPGKGGDLLADQRFAFRVSGGNHHPGTLAAQRHDHSGPRRNHGAGGLGGGQTQGWLPVHLKPFCAGKVARHDHHAKVGGMHRACFHPHQHFARAQGRDRALLDTQDNRPIVLGLADETAGLAGRIGHGVPLSGRSLSGWPLSGWPLSGWPLSGWHSAGCGLWPVCQVKSICNLPAWGKA